MVDYKRVPSKNGTIYREASSLGRTEITIDELMEIMKRK